MKKNAKIRRWFWLMIPAITLSGASCQKEITADKEQRRANVLFIAVDDLRPMLGCYGDAGIKTPNIDRLASGSTLFERAYCNVPVCGASRASILTGLRPGRNRFLDYDTWTQDDAPGITSLPAHFRQNGYYTVSLGKVFHFPDDLEESSWSEKPWRAKAAFNGKVSMARNYLLTENQVLQARPGKRGPAYEMADVPDSDYFDGEMTGRAIAKLKELSRRDTSFFLALGYLKPHLPFNAPKKYWDMYPEAEVSLADNQFWPKDAPREGWYGTGELRKYHATPEDGPVPDSLALKLVRGYRACVSYTDALIGQVLRTLKETGLDKNTIVVLWGDHGYLLGEHKLWCKHITFNKALQVPLLIAAPEYPQGQRAAGLVEYVDIYPTLCELAGLGLPAHLQGESLVPLLKDPKGNGKEFILSRYLKMEAVKTDRFLYTEWIDSSGNVKDRMLYDHHNDPGEDVNIAESEAYREVVEELSKTLEEAYADAEK